jgi:hypothetical protein
VEILVESPGEQQGIGILQPVVRRLQPLQILAAVAGGLGRSLGQPPLSGKLSARFDPSTRGPNRRS